MQAREVMICTPVRTAIGTYGGSLKATPATALGATAIKAVLDRSGLDPAKVGTVVFGNVIQAGNRMNPARQAAVTGGVPVEAPAMTVNRVCARAPRPSRRPRRRSGSASSTARSPAAWRTWTWPPT